MERYEHFVKQTYRNRCLIATTQGVQALTVPIERGSGEKCLIKDLRISDKLRQEVRKNDLGMFTHIGKEHDYLLDKEEN